MVTPRPTAVTGAAAAAVKVFNRDVSWHTFATDSYLADNYTSLHRFDREIISALSPYYQALAPGSLASALDVGTGPNLYPLMLAAAAARQLHALDRSATNVAYLQRACREGADPSWAPFWHLCRQLDPALPSDLNQVLAKLTVHHGDAFNLPAAQHNLVSMFFMAESVTGDREEFQQLSQRFAAAAAPDGHLIAAFMAGMPQYELAGQTLPSFPLDQHTLETVMQPVTEQLRVWQLPADPTLPYQHEGVLLLTARARHHQHIVLPH